MALQLHKTTFAFHAASDQQKADMETVRQAAKNYADILEANLPEGADKTYTLRKLREVAMWANVAITREANGAPRSS